MTNNSQKLAKKLKERFAQKQSLQLRYPAVMGDGRGNLEVTGAQGFIYVTINGKAVSVFNNLVPNQAGTEVWVGKLHEEDNFMQVLSTMGDTPTGANRGYLGYAPARRYEWHAVNGGQDPLYVHQRALTHLRLSVSDTEPPAGELYVNLYRGFVYAGSRYYSIPRQDLDLSAHVPTTADKAAFVLITISNTGTVVQTKGSEVNIDALAITDIPSIPADTAWVSGAVRVYNGQLKVLEARTNTDFVDLRWLNNFAARWDDLSGIPDYIGKSLEPLTVVIPKTVHAVFIDGALAAATNVGGVYVVERAMTLYDVAIHCQDKGSASSTKVDVNLNGTTIFTDQAKRPSLAYNAALDYDASDTPDLVDVFPGDILTWDIDQVATGASGLKIELRERIVEPVTIEDSIATALVELT